MSIRSNSNQRIGYHPSTQLRRMSADVRFGNVLEQTAREENECVENNISGEARYTVSELKALQLLVVKTREMLRCSDRLFDKHTWSEIAERMHICGWPRRSWRSVKFRGEQFLSRRSTGDSSEAPGLRNTGLKQIDHQVPSIVSIPDTDVLGSSTCNITEKPSTSISDEGTELTPPARTSQIPVPPPPLIPSSEATAFALLSRQNNVSMPKTKLFQSNSNGVVRPQIIHICSKAVPTVFKAKTSTVNNSKPAMIVGSGVVAPDKSNFIDLSNSSNEDDGQNLKGNSGDTGAVKSSVLPESRLPLTSLQRLLMPDLVPDITELEFRKRMDIYKLKQDVLQLKKAYWTSKLKGLLDVA
ncbi:unnamed protein product [Calicophoron daubneyi]|uniref:Uncharacterized protein n=1 Tax=Calicophoron daubneyi TaxID=300641 RepID=A0AAV2T505_CALDB